MHLHFRCLHFHYACYYYYKGINYLSGGLIMEIIREFRRQNRNFWQYFWKYSQIIILIQLIINFIVVPVLSFLANGINYIGKVNYVSYNNVLELITHKPLVVIGLIMVLLILLLLVFAQFTLLLVSFQAIKSHASLNWWDYLKSVSKNLFGLPFKAFGFFLLYFLIIIPFGSFGLYSSLLNKVKIPEFILDWLFQEHLPLGILLAFIYIVIFYIGLRWILVLPSMIFKNKSVGSAINDSWRKTKGKTIQYFGVFLLLFIIVSIVTFLSTSILIFCQSVIDKTAFLTKIDFPMAVFNMVAIQLINYLTSLYGLGMAVLIILSDTTTNYFFPTREHRYHKWFWGILGAAVLTSFVSYDVSYFNNWLLTKPITISHRGVDDGNGVQNTIESLKKTAKEKPDYIEMDLQETKDHQFVVFHDNTLKNLAGINKRVSQMTLKELKNTTVHENGQTTHIASFDDYLATATDLHQKLLVELKDVPGNKADFVRLFAKKYGKRLVKNQDMIHSLDYDYIQETKNLIPKAQTSYILTFNLFGVPLTNANAFTMEYSTLNQSFVDDAHLQRKNVYAWTVNDPEAMERMIFMGTDGVITDNLTELKSEINNLFKDSSYSDRMASYVTQMQNPFE
ncbi:glycerophosphodiester phosphodiesterase [Lactobacillus halodurans]|uniref:Glycerophosphodiester phosphodiesterase n=2 Tax=Companilactobacillus halodurans TaxID=2584183 RepID=A0A5P0ZXD0_9LACO|nr:glycerophosphodiester phosphodiesterase [Companilactobacillus halodurans]